MALAQVRAPPCTSGRGQGRGSLAGAVRDPRRRPRRRAGGASAPAPLRPEAELERYTADDAVAAARVGACAPVTPTPRAAYVLGRGRAARASRCPPGLVQPRRASRDRDAATRRRPGHRSVSARGAAALVRGVAAPLRIETAAPSRRVQIRQARPADVDIEPSEAERAPGRERAAQRRGEAALPPVRPAASDRSDSAEARSRGEGEAPTLVYPDVAQPAASWWRSGGASSATRACQHAGRSGSAPTSSRSATTGPTTTSARSTGGDRAHRAPDEQPVPRRAGPRRRVPPRRGRLDDGTDRRPDHPSRRGGRRGRRWSGSSPTSSATAAGVPRSTPRSRRNRGRGATATGVVRAILDAEPTSVDSDYDLAFRTVCANAHW